MKLNIAVAALSVSAASATWPGTKKGEVVQNASGNFESIYYLGKGLPLHASGPYDPLTIPAELTHIVPGQTAAPSVDVSTEAKCASECQTRFPDGLGSNYPLQGFTFYISGTTKLCSCFQKADSPVDSLDYASGASGCSIQDPANPTDPSATIDVSCDTVKTYCYGCLKDSVNGGELAPSNQPSRMPSQSPSYVPSASPSDQPSGKPSRSPSDQPSDKPSSLPSCTPSVGPTPSPSINLFYPDQTQAGFETGCLNDGQQPAWMEANPTNWLFSTLNKCCTQHFSWNYDFCMGNLDDTCARELWYPDWEKANKGCVRDGEEPLYMTANSGIYLYNTKADCCEEHYSWDLATCMGGAAGSTSGTKWYADWETGDDTCKNDGKAPDYMVATSVNWLYADKKDCCTRFFSYSLANCMGTSTSSKGSGKYYPDWVGHNGCLVDNGSTPAPEYMRATEAWFYDTLDKCCSQHFGHNLSGCKGAASATAYTGNEKWYLMWSSGKCVQDCATKTGTKCGGLSDSWDIKYDSQAKCCNERSWWNIKECMA